MYDEYCPSPPSTPSSSRLRAIPHLHTHSSPLSSPTTHAHPYGRRASKASDIAHLLDPSYSPPRTDTYLSQIYVDHAGEAHDPDFRLFAPAGYSPKRREFLTCESDDDDAADDNAPDDDDAPWASYAAPARASFDSARSARSASHAHAHRPHSRASDPARAVPYATFTYTFDEQGYVSDDEPRREANKLRRRRASLEHDRPAAQPERAAEQRRTECTNSCSSTTTTFRRQWHALRLRTQVAAFRARKRVTRIVSPSTG